MRISVWFPIVFLPLPKKEGEALGTLFDMEKDPKEENYLYLEHPDIIKELNELLEEQKELGYTRKIGN